MAATQTTNNNSIRSILEKEKLNGSNFIDWYRNLRIILRNEQKLHHLEEALPKAPPATSTAAVRNAYTRRVAEQQEVACLMLVEKQTIVRVSDFESQKIVKSAKVFDGKFMIKTGSKCGNDRFIISYDLHNEHGDGPEVLLGFGVAFSSRQESLVIGKTLDRK
ncbi:hypothetical protein Tco_0257149 [Tanacetum coccineum]